jgi:hypothetical protein
MTPTKIFVPFPPNPAYAVEIENLLDVITGNSYDCHSPVRTPQGWEITMTGPDPEVKRAIYAVAALICTINQAVTAPVAA